MPHVIVKAQSGRSEEKKQRLTDAILRDVTEILGCEAGSVSIAFEDVEPGRWKEEVYLPDIEGRWDTLRKTPGYEI